MKFDGIVRVSRVGSRDQSLKSDVQQEAEIRAWAAREGHEIVQIHVERDVSGRTTKRPALERAKARALSGEVDGLAAVYLSRFTRNTVEGLELVKELRDAGRSFVAFDAQYPLDTPEGEFMLTIQLAQARQQLQILTAGFERNRREAIESGVHLTEVFGYRKNGGGRLEIDPAEGPWVPEIFVRRAAGRSWHQIADWLNAEGVATHAYSDRRDGRPSRRRQAARWRHGAVKRIVECKTYLGVAHSGSDYVNAEAHPPLVSPELWEAANARRNLRPRRGRAEYELSGVVYCEACRQRMRGTTTHRAGRAYRYYGCSRECSIGRRVRAELVERNAHGALVRAIDRRLELVADEATDDFEAAIGELAKVEAAHERLSRDHEYREADRDGFLSAVKDMAERVEAAKARVQVARERRLGMSITPDQLAGWADLSVDERRHLLAEALDVVIVSADRRRFCAIPRGEAGEWQADDPDALARRLLPLSERPEA